MERREPLANGRGGGTGRPAGERGTVPSRAGVRAKNRKRRRRRALLLFYIFLFVAVVSAAVILSLTVLFKIDSIEVSGTSCYSKDQIINACGIRKGENLFLAGTGRAEKQIQAKLPYIGSVRVRRTFPAKISIQVTAARVFGAVACSKKYAVLSGDFRVLELVDKLPAGCPLIRGVALKTAKAGSGAEFSNASTRSALQSVTAALNQNGLEDKISGMDFSSNSKILLVYDGRVTMDLGLPSGLDYKIRYAKKLFDSGKITKTDRGTLNLSTVEDNDTAYFDPATAS